MKKEKRIITDNLPKSKNGSVKWKECVGLTVPFIYDDIIGEIKILEYIKDENNIFKFKIIYENTEFEIRVGDFQRCRLGKLLKKRTNEFKINIGTIFKDSKRNITIIDKEYRITSKISDKTGKTILTNEKWYRYNCNICGWNEGWVLENTLTSRQQGCSCCRGLTVVRGINDVATTHPHLVKYFINIEDAYNHTIGSGKTVKMKCPICNSVKELKIETLRKQGFGCNICSDGISYPEKVVGNILKEFNIDFTPQYSKTNDCWCKNYRYDFYFEYNGESYIIETHGMQHFQEKFKGSSWGSSLEDVQNNDKNKKDLAMQNVDHYIIIDCRYSDLEYIKQNILQSDLSKIFNFKDIDWIKIGKLCEKSLVKDVCDYWEKWYSDNIRLSALKIANVFKIGETTAREYLKRGTQLGWCSYKV